MRAVGDCGQSQTGRQTCQLLDELGGEFSSWGDRRCTREQLDFAEGLSTLFLNDSGTQNSWRGQCWSVRRKNIYNSNQAHFDILWVRNDAQRGNRWAVQVLLELPGKVKMQPESVRYTWRSTVIVSDVWCSLLLFNCSLSLFALKPLLDRNNLISYFACSLPLTALMISVS